MGFGMTDDEVAARSHANCIAYACEGARRAGISGEIVEHGGIVRYAGSSDFPVFANGAFRLDPSVPADRVVDLADEWFSARGRGWSIGTTSWGGLDDDLAEATVARGLFAVTDSPAMVVTERLAAAPAPDDVEVRVLRTQPEAEAFVAMVDAAYTSLGLPAGVLDGMAGRPIRMPVNEVTFGVFDGDDLVSGAQVYLSHGIAGIYCVGTTDAARGRGLAELATRIATNAGFDAGAALVTLQASPMGEAIYRRLGYRELYRYRTFARFV